MKKQKPTPMEQALAKFQQEIEIAIERVLPLLERGLSDPGSAELVLSIASSLKYRCGDIEKEEIQENAIEKMIAKHAATELAMDAGRRDMINIIADTLKKALKK